MESLYISDIFFIFISLVKAVQFKMSTWVHNYINMQDNLNYVENESMEHSVFYSVCQALFLIVTKRHNDYPDSKKCKYFAFINTLNPGRISYVLE